MYMYMYMYIYIYKQFLFHGIEEGVEETALFSSKKVFRTVLFMKINSIKSWGNSSLENLTLSAMTRFCNS